MTAHTLESGDSTSSDVMTRFLLGIVLPFAMQFVAYALYSAVRFGAVKLSTLLASLFVVFPALFFYFIGGRLVWNVCGMNGFLSKNLTEHLDEIFISGRATPLMSGEADVGAHIARRKPELNEHQTNALRAKIREEVIPNSLRHARREYTASFVGRPNRSRNERLLTYYEGILFFGFVTALLVVVDLVILAVLSQTNIELDFVYLDRITSPLNLVLIWAAFTGVLLTAITGVQSTVSRIRELIPLVSPIVYYESRESRNRRISALRAVVRTPVDRLLGMKPTRSLYPSIEKMYDHLLTPLLVESLQWEVRGETARATVWRQYRKVLDELRLSETALKDIETRFLGADVGKLVSERAVVSEELADGILSDLDYVTARIAKWDESNEEEQSLAFLLLYRSAESIIQVVVSQLAVTHIEELNLLAMINFLKERQLISGNEAIMLHRLRHLRNVIMHQPGKKIAVDKNAMHGFLGIIQNVAERLLSESA